MTKKEAYLLVDDRQTGVSGESKQTADELGLPEKLLYCVNNVGKEHIQPEDRERYQKELDDIPSFLEHLQQMTEDDNETAAMMVVIDMFSSINSLYGYEVGGKVLRKFAEKMQRIIGERGTVYHLYGGVFGICLKAHTKREIRDFYLQIQNAGYDGITLGSRRVVLKTLGSATIFGSQPGESGRIVSHLGYVIGHSRSAFHSELVFFDLMAPNHEEDDRNVLGVIYQDIMKGCENFRLFYQPIIQAKSGKVVGAEALIRWEKEPYGRIAPDRFIPFMESNPCIYELGNWVVRQALEDAKRFSRVLPGFIINVNVAPTQLERKDFAQEIVDMVQASGYPAERLCLEFTERCRELDYDFLRQKMDFFHAYGIRVAMDDFGTGHAALQMVMQLPFDEIKIDRSFVEDIVNHTISQVIVEGISREAKVIHADICVEGIEKQETVDYLKRYEPTYYQGYLYSKPVPKEQFLSLISA